MSSAALSGCGPICVRLINNARIITNSAILLSVKGIFFGSCKQTNIITIQKIIGPKTKIIPTLITGILSKMMSVTELLILSFAYSEPK
jgi:hypothetical protein